MPKFAVVLTTCASEEETENIAQALLGEKLAACIQACPIRSYYTWKGQFRAENETLMFIKCKEADYSAIEECIKANHSYELPEVIQLPILAGSQEYLNWIRAVTI